MDTVSQIAGTFFDGVWKLLLKTDFPGIGVSFAAVMISLLIIRFSIRIFQMLTGFGASGGDYGRAANSAEKLKSDRSRTRRNGISKSDL